MIYSPNFHFNIPSRDVDDIVDINQLSENFRIIDEDIPSREEMQNAIEEAIQGLVGDFVDVSEVGR